VAEAVAEGDVVSVLLPDQVQRYVYAEQIAPNLKEGSALLFAHGFNIRYGYIEVPEGHDVVMVAPKGPGHKVRETYTQGKGTPDVVAVEVDASGQAWDLVLSYAKASGGTRAVLKGLPLRPATPFTNASQPLQQALGHAQPLVGVCQLLIKVVARNHQGR